MDSRTRDEKATISDCLEMIRFGMGHQLITFEDKCYECSGYLNIEDCGLTIGGYGSAFLADPFASCSSEKLFRDSAHNG
jgi:hypothetical protein